MSAVGVPLAVSRLLPEGREPLRSASCALMLTPDIEILDRRIAQEAGSLARIGLSVDIFPVFDSLSGVADSLPAGVRLLEQPRRPSGPRVASYRGAQRLKRGLKRFAPRLHQCLEVAQSLLLDRGALSTTEAEAALMAGGRYDLVFAHDTPMLPLATHLAKAWSATVICDLHEIFPEQHHIRDEWWTYRSMKRLDAHYLPLADGVLCVNPAVREYVQRIAGVTAPVGVVYNSVPYASDPSRGPGVRAVYPISTDTRVLLFAGSLRPDANLEFLIRAFALADVPGWVLAIIGSGPQEADLRTSIAAVGATGRIHIGKRVAQDELVSVLASGDAAVMPYVAVDYNHLIATPNKLFEYVQARLPIISSDLPQVRRIIVDHGNGVLADFSTVESAAAALRAFLTEGLIKHDPDILEAAARALCWERDEAVLLATCAEALQRRHPAAEGTAGP